jgi:DNA-binding transcriptional ArsR family regulator
VQCMHICAYHDVMAMVRTDGSGTADAVDPGPVGATRRALPAREEAAAIAEGFKVLGDATRVRVLFALREAGELCVGDLAATVGVAQPAVSQSLRVLRAAGIVTARRAGRLSYYSLADDHVRMLLEVTREHHDHQTGGAR